MKQEFKQIRRILQMIQTEAERIPNTCILDELKDLEDLIDEVDQELDDALSERDSLQETINDYEEQIEILEGELQDAKDELDSNNG